MPPTKQLY